jgi:small-conductance mechanosensitive channel
MLNDLITIDTVTGRVQSIDLFSIKMRTADGKLVRIPNETVLQKTITNVSFYPKIRVEIKLYVLPETHVGELIEAVQKKIMNLEYVLEPLPTLYISNASAYQVELTVLCWVAPAHASDLKTALSQELKQLSQEKNSWIGCLS